MHHSFPTEYRVRDEEDRLNILIVLFNTNYPRFSSRCVRAQIAPVRWSETRGWQIRAYTAEVYQMVHSEKNMKCTSRLSSPIHSNPFAPLLPQKDSSLWVKLLTTCREIRINKRSYSDGSLGGDGGGSTSEGGCGVLRWGDGLVARSARI